MKLKVKNLVRKSYALIQTIHSHHTGAYAAQAAFFFILSLIPIMILLLTMLQFTPVTKQDVMAAVTVVFPSTVEGLMEIIVNQVYMRTSGLIPITILVAIWSAGKGVLAVTAGLNLVYDHTETRNYIYLRIRASFYTVLFILAIVLSLTFSVFGNSISQFVYKYIPFLTQIVNLVIQIRTFLTLMILTVFWDFAYKFLPNRTELSRTTLKKQLPGAIMTSCGWLLGSYIFSVYLDVFTGFSSMYGSLTTIVLVMLWLYFCMYTILLGGELNACLEDFERRQKSRM